MHVINDGVFSHTGCDSVYFNRKGRYQSVGAYNSQESPYSSWYHFSQWPDQYNSWWGFYTLPEVNETDPKFNEYINGKDGIVRKWMKAGNSGWRLDVADELPDEFLENLRKAVRRKTRKASSSVRSGRMLPTKKATGTGGRFCSATSSTA